MLMQNSTGRGARVTTLTVKKHHAMYSTQRLTFEDNQSAPKTLKINRWSSVPNLKKPKDPIWFQQRQVRVAEKFLNFS